MGMKDRLERGTGYFVSLSEVVASMAADGDNYRDAATVLYRLLRNEHSRAPEWIVDGLEGLWSPEDEDLSDAWEALEKAAKSGRLRGKKVMEYGFFGGEIIPFLAKYGVDISPSIPTPTPEQQVHQTEARAGRTPPTPSELPGQDSDTAAEASSEVTEKGGEPAKAIGITKAEILCVAWPMPAGAPTLESILNKRPKWVGDACNKVGSPGKGRSGSHRWNPAILAVCLSVTTPHKQWTCNKQALTNLIRASFSDYLEEWETASELL